MYFPSSRMLPRTLVLGDGLHLEERERRRVDDVGVAFLPDDLRTGIDALLGAARDGMNQERLALQRIPVERQRTAPTFFRSTTRSGAAETTNRSPPATVKWASSAAAESSSEVPPHATHATIAPAPKHTATANER